MADAQLGRASGKIAAITVPAIVAAGSLVGYLANSGIDNGWYAGLVRPGFQPPSWAFGVVWTILYAMMGVALAMILALPKSARRTTALQLFFAQLALNFAWSPIFFAGQMIDLALVDIAVMLVLALATAKMFRALCPVAGWLLLPYLAWLCLATALNYETGRLNPGADSHPLGITGA